MTSRALWRSLPVSHRDGEMGVPEEGMMVLLLSHCQALEKHLKRIGKGTEEAFLHQREKGFREALAGHFGGVPYVDMKDMSTRSTIH